MKKKKRTIIRQPKIGTPQMRMIILVFFVLLIFVADIFLLFDHNKTFSENENRVLQQAPELTMTSLISGKFMTQEDDFVTDQFFLRDTWISLKLFLDKASGKVESNDIYLGKQNYLIQKPVKPVKEFFDRNLAAINVFASKYSDIDFVMTLIPGTAAICDQLLPNQAPCISVPDIITSARNGLSGAVKFIDVTAALKAHKEEELYYKGDHHWKSLGAYYAFEAMTDMLRIDSPVNNYSVMTVTNDFVGTMASNSGATYVKDSIEIYVPLVGNALGEDSASKALASTLEYVVEYADAAGTKKSATIYSSEALEQKDKYQVFLGGNHPRINIKTNVDNGKNLLILKDSYANTFIQFLLPYYHTIIVVDPRYYSDDISKLMSDCSITNVLILYYENNFVTDNSLFGVLEDAGGAPVMETPAEAENTDTGAEDDSTEE